MEQLQVNIQENQFLKSEASPSRRLFENQETVEITFKDLLYQVNAKNKNKGMVTRTILNKISGYCPSGQITAILGASGAGKTSLLNILAQRIGKGGNVSVTGDICANGQPYDSSRFASFASYVMQNDILMETLTAREVFTFIANLKYKDEKMKQQRINETIRSLKLERCQHSLIGGIMIKGISGGERKRVSIGVELVSNPRVILLDEPTSGLDSFTAFITINLLKKICREQNRTVVFTIHQPSGDIYELFDRIMLLVDGKFIYQGPKTQLIPYFSNMGFECPPLTNPMDYVISIMHSEKQENIQSFPIYFNTYNTKLASFVDKEIEDSCRLTISVIQSENTFGEQVYHICHRAFVNVKRDKMQVAGRIFAGIFLGLLSGGIYFGVGKKSNSIEQVQNMSGVFFFICMNHFMGSVNPVMIAFPAERDVFLREENSKLYSASAYFLGKSSVEIPFQIVIPMVQQIILYWMIGLNDDNAGIVLSNFLIYVLLSMAGNSVGLMGGTMFQDVKTAAGILPMFIMPLVLFSGFFQNQDNFMDWIGWIQWISPLKYAFEAAITNEYTGVIANPDPLALLNFDLGIWPCVFALIGFIFAYRIIAFIFLILLKSKQQ